MQYPNIDSLMFTTSTQRNVPALYRIGTAGWSIPAGSRGEFPISGSLLERYASVFNAVEINSSFYRPHRRTTYERWAGSVPDDFRFSVKMPKQITHELKLRGFDIPLDSFLDEIGGLEQKLGAILIQLPPRLAFDQETASDFVSHVRSLLDVLLAIEPRHPSWFTAQAAETLMRSEVELIVADPPPCPGAPFLDKTPKAAYFRLHGAPRVYYSDYPEDDLAALALKVSRADQQCWCIFDNTAAGQATANALSLRRQLAISKSCSSHRSAPADRR